MKERKSTAVLEVPRKKKLETTSVSLIVGHFYFKKSLVIFNKVKNQ